MANVKITNLTAATVPLAGTELLELVQGGSSTKVAASAVANSATGVRTVATGGTGAATLTGYVKGTGTTAMTASATIPVTDITGTATVAQGGTGAATLTGYVKGNGTSAMTASATVPYGDVSGRAWINTSSNINQTGSTTTATAVTMNTGTTGTGITVNASTQITFTDAGTYMVSPSIHFTNSAATDYIATVWFRKNGTNIANSGSVTSVPKAADGGLLDFGTTWIETVTAGQYIEIMFLVQNAAVSVLATAAGAVAPAIPSVIVPVMRIA